MLQQKWLVSLSALAFCLTTLSCKPREEEEATTYGGGNTTTDGLDAVPSNTFGCFGSTFDKGAQALKQLSYIKEFKCEKGGYVTTVFDKDSQEYKDLLQLGFDAAKKAIKKNPGSSSLVKMQLLGPKKSKALGLTYKPLSLAEEKLASDAIDETYDEAVKKGFSQPSHIASKAGRLIGHALDVGGGAIIEIPICIAAVVRGNHEDQIDREKRERGEFTSGCKPEATKCKTKWWESHANVSAAKHCGGAAFSMITTMGATAYATGSISAGLGLTGGALAAGAFWPIAIGAAAAYIGSEAIQLGIDAYVFDHYDLDDESRISQKSPPFFRRYTKMKEYCRGMDEMVIGGDDSFLSATTIDLAMLEREGQVSASVDIVTDDQGFFKLSCAKWDGIKAYYTIDHARMMSWGCINYGKGSQENPMHMNFTVKKDFSIELHWENKGIKGYWCSPFAFIGRYKEPHKECSMHWRDDGRSWHYGGTHLLNGRPCIQRFLPWRCYVLKHDAVGPEDACRLSAYDQRTPPGHKDYWNFHADVFKHAKHARKNPESCYGYTRQWIKKHFSNNQFNDSHKLTTHKCTWSVDKVIDYGAM